MFRRAVRQTKWVFAQTFSTPADGLLEKCCLCAVKGPMCKGYTTAPKTASTPRVHPRALEMSAWQIHQYGGIEELTLSHSVRVPALKNPWDVLVEVHAASINPIDVLLIGKH